MKTTVRAFALLLALCPAASAAAASGLVVCDVGGPGNTAQAQPTLDNFLRHIEKTAGLEAGRLTGEYHTEMDDCLAYIKNQRPALAVLDLATYLQQARDLQLEPLAHLGPPDRQRYHVLVKKGAYTDLASLKGKKVVSSDLDDPRFAARIVFGGKIDPSAEFQLEHTRRPLKAIRQVVRGESDAAVVNADTFAHLGDLQLPEEPVAIFASEALPGLTMAVVQVNGAEQKALAEKVRGVVGALCAGDGAELCKNFGIEKIVPADAPRLDALRKRYEAP